MSDRQPRARRVLQRLLRGTAAAHVYVSEAVRDSHHATIGAARREAVIPNGIDLAPFLALEPGPGPVLGALGRMEPRTKGFDVLLRAFALLGDASLRLRIGGDGPERPLLEALARELGVADRVEFAGFVEDVPAFLGGLNAFVNPSRWEAFGLTLVEGLAAGLPCAATRVGGLVEVGGLTEVGGEFVDWAPPDDAPALAEAMRAALSGAGDASRTESQRAHVTARFSREAMAEGYLGLYGDSLA